MLYQCPICSQKLIKQDRFFRCSNNHQFDIAKEGYVNLIPAHHKRSKDPGDNSEMMLARRKFLEQSHFAPMAKAVAKLAKQVNDGALLDIGCGEGYYTDHIALANPYSTYGLDISKVAIRLASKKYTTPNFCVASSHRLPFSDQTLSTIIRIYAPCKAKELQRVLKDNGFVITVTPAARHLYQLRALIYDDVRLHQSDEQIEGFELVERHNLNYSMPLVAQQTLQLLQMTPFAWKITPEVEKKIVQMQSLTVEADFCISLFRKNGK